MVSNQWNLERSNIPESMECSGTALIFTLAKCTQPWQRIKAVEEILHQCGLDPFGEVLDIPKSGILGEDIPESARKPHPNLLFRALAIQALGKIPDVQLESEFAVRISDFSKNLLTVLEQEARSGETPLIRWSAAVIIQSIWRDEEGERHSNDSAVKIDINAPEIEIKIAEEQVKLLLDYRIYRDSNTDNGSAKQFENFLDFWVYGPSWLLFSLQMDCEEYLFWLDLLFAPIAVTEVQYGLNNVENDATVKNFLESIANNFNEADFSKILAKIFEFIQHPESRVKDEAATLLEPYKDRLDQKSALIMKALAYRFNLESQRLESLTIPEIEECQALFERCKIEIDGVYSKALSVCGDRDAEMANFLSAKHLEYQNTVEEQINNLSKLIKSIIDCQGLLDANRELLYLTVERLQTWDYTLDHKLAAHQKKLQSLGVDSSTCEQCINLDSDLNSIRDSLQYTLYEVTSKINSKIRELELSASKNNKTATDMFKWTWVLLGVWFSVGLFLYLSDSVINSIFTESYQTEFLIYWTVFLIVMVLILLILAIFFSTISALEKHKESKLIPKFDNLSQIASNFSSMWQKSYLQQFVPSVRSN
ncbi:MAG: hypothetical protein HC789_04535 [Microcoleus sp. CSU_2_2]|nr:hypothetical protein [Microcoleus sp. SU_5_3]NJS09694.1 hypothetical protein [Microcoleus sp. CSU_2_2]